MPENFYLTTPLYYVNDVPHIGHLYTTVAADALARYHRACGRTVHFLTGTDEHGQKIEEAATARGLTPIALADEVHQRFKEAWARAGVRYDDFIRTTEARHKAVVTWLWRRLAERGDIYLAQYEGQYCVGCEDFYTETQAPSGKCPVHQSALTPMKEESYFFRLSKYEGPLLAYYAAHPELIRPENRLNEIVAFVRGGLRDLSVSRRKLRWGIPVPGNEEHVMYVWLDALTNYLSARCVGADAPGADVEALVMDALAAGRWPADLHVIGKDILRFHAVYWPAFLLAAGLPLPKQIFAHGWWTVEGQKMSKSLRNVVGPSDLFDAYGVDATRYFLLREFPFGADGDYSATGATGRYNAELANDLGNLLNRTVTMCARYLGGTVPGATRDEGNGALADLAHKAIAEYHRALEDVGFSRALEAAMSIVRATNSFVQTQAPWALQKAGDDVRLRSVLAATCEALRVAGALLAPVMPDKMAGLRQQLGLDAQAPMLAGLAFGAFAGPFRIGEPQVLFPRLELAATKPSSDASSEALPHPAKATNPVKPASDANPVTTEQPATLAKPAELASVAPAAVEEIALVGYEDFAKLELRVGLVKSAERIKKSDKLLRLIVDIGEERQIVAGIGKRFAPEDLVGRRVTVVANLRPAKLMGVESHGMILAAGGELDLELASVPEGVAPGTRVK